MDISVKICIQVASFRKIISLPGDKSIRLKIHKNYMDGVARLSLEPGESPYIEASSICSGWGG